MKDKYKNMMLGYFASETRKSNVDSNPIDTLFVIGFWLGGIFAVIAGAYSLSYDIIGYINIMGLYFDGIRLFILALFFIILSLISIYILIRMLFTLIWNLFERFPRRMKLLFFGPPIAIFIVWFFGPNLGIDIYFWS